VNIFKRFEKHDEVVRAFSYFLCINCVLFYILTRFSDPHKGYTSSGFSTATETSLFAVHIFTVFVFFPIYFVYLLVKSAAAKNAQLLVDAAIGIALAYVPMIVICLIIGFILR
jgi:hypothetical protein